MQKESRPFLPSKSMSDVQISEEMPYQLGCHQAELLQDLLHLLEM